MHWPVDLGGIDINYRAYIQFLENLPSDSKPYSPWGIRFLHGKEPSFSRFIGQQK